MGGGGKDSITLGEGEKIASHWGGGGKDSITLGGGEGEKIASHWGGGEGEKIASHWGEGEKIASQILLLNVTFETPFDFVLIMKL